MARSATLLLLATLALAAASPVSAQVRFPVLLSADSPAAEIFAEGDRFSSGVFAHYSHGSVLQQTESVAEDFERPRWHYALFGAGVGTVVGGAYGLYWDLTCESFCGTNWMIGAAGGAGLGAFLGWLFSLPRRQPDPA